jgi:hypothetical protein
MWTSIDLHLSGWSVREPGLTVKVSPAANTRKSVIIWTIYCVTTTNLTEDELCPPRYSYWYRGTMQTELRTWGLQVGPISRPVVTRHCSVCYVAPIPVMCNLFYFYWQGVQTNHVAAPFSPAQSWHRLLADFAKY